MSDIGEAVNRLTAATAYENRGPAGTCAVHVDDLRALLDAYRTAQGELAAWKENSDAWQESAEQLNSEVEELKARPRQHDLL